MCSISARRSCAPWSRRRGDSQPDLQRRDTTRIITAYAIAEIVGKTFPGCEVTLAPSGGDNRSYRVAFDNIHRELPGFKCDWMASAGSEQLREVYERIAMPAEIFQFRPFTRLKQLEYLIKTRKIDEEFYWRY